MKVLIWVGCFLFYTVLSVLIGYATGFAPGSILIYLAWWFTSRALSRKWDEHRENKELSKLQSISFEQLPETLLEICREKAADSDDLYDYLEQCVDDGFITNACAQVLYERFTQPQVSQTRFCHACGEPLDTVGDWCRKCGAKAHNT